MKERSLFIQKFEQIARADPRVLSAFLGGSLADGTEDDFSDIDIYYILEEQSYSEFPSQMRARLGEMGPLVFLEQHNNFGFDLILFIFQNGVKGELGLGTIKNLKTLHAGPYKVLVDKKHLLDEVVFPFQPSLERENLQEYVEKQLRWYWYWYSVFLSAVARERLWSAFSQLQQMRDYAFRLIVLAHHPQRIPGQRFERTVPLTVRDELGNRSLPQYSRSSMISSADALTEIMKREIKQLLMSSHANYPADLEATVLNKKQSIMNSSLNGGSEVS
jgi:predicted nucleotidyltransferase